MKSALTLLCLIASGSAAWCDDTPASITSGSGGIVAVVNGASASVTSQSLAVSILLTNKSPQVMQAT